MAVKKVSAAHLCLTLIIKELKISVGQDRVVTTWKYNETLNIIFSVVWNHEQDVIALHTFWMKTHSSWDNQWNSLPCVYRGLHQYLIKILMCSLVTNLWKFFVLFCFVLFLFCFLGHLSHYLNFFMPWGCPVLIYWHLGLFWIFVTIVYNLYEKYFYCSCQTEVRCFV